VRRLPEGRAELRLEDDGVGLPEGVRTHLPRHCLGLHLASRLARQARGRLHLEGPPGTAAVVVFATG
jgi:two-component sensor histidine kinase